jgi:hypothetical protein
MTMQTFKIDRSKFGQRYVEQFKGKHYFALSLLIGSPTGERQIGLNAQGEPMWIYRSAKQAHRSFAWYTPGDWYNAPQGEKVLGVMLVREDGTVWTKQ